MKKIILLFSIFVGMSLEAQTKTDIRDCVQEFFDNLSDLNQILPGESLEINKARELQRIYQGEFFNFNGRNDVSLNEFLTYYKTYVLGNALVSHDIIGMKISKTSATKDSHSYRLSNVRIRRTFDYQRVPSSISQQYNDIITCTLLITWMGEDANTCIRINGISYSEPLEKSPQVIAIKRKPVFKVSNATATVSAQGGSHRVSVTSYCDTEYIYTNGKSRVKRETLAFKVLGNRYEVKNNEVRFDYSSNPNRQERILSWILEQNETGETRKLTVRQEKRKIEIDRFFDFEDSNPTNSVNLHYIPNGVGFSFQYHFEDSRFGMGLIGGFTFFNDPDVESSLHLLSTSIETISDDTSIMTSFETIGHSDVCSSPEIKVNNELSFYRYLGIISSFAINSYLSIEYSPMCLWANHRYDLDGTWERKTTIINQYDKQDITVEYQIADSQAQKLWLYKNYKTGFMNRFGMRAFIPLGDNWAINLGYGYNINTIKGIPHFSDFSIGFRCVQF
jgi:hypothetical protein